VSPIDPQQMLTFAAVFVAEKNLKHDGKYN